MAEPPCLSRTLLCTVATGLRAWLRYRVSDLARSLPNSVWGSPAQPGEALPFQSRVAGERMRPARVATRVCAPSGGGWP